MRLLSKRYFIFFLNTVSFTALSLYIFEYQNAESCSHLVLKSIRPKISSLKWFSTNGQVHEPCLVHHHFFNNPEISGPLCFWRPWYAYMPISWTWVWLGLELNRKSTTSSGAFHIEISANNHPHRSFSNESAILVAFLLIARVNLQAGYKFCLAIWPLPLCRA